MTFESAVSHRSLRLDEGVPRRQRCQVEGRAVRDRWTIDVLGEDPQQCAHCGSVWPSDVSLLSSYHVEPFAPLHPVVERRVLKPRI